MIKIIFGIVFIAIGFCYAFAQDAKSGQKIFKTYCASCHGEKGKADGPASATLNPKPPDLSDAHMMSTLSDEYLRKIIKGGGRAVGKSPVMPAWGSVLKEKDINDVIAFIRLICNCKYKK